MNGSEHEPPAIEVVGVGKRYTKYEDTPMLISRLLQLRNRTRRSTLWAIREATFDVDRGECIGVIGRNGSGKSTLLQLLAGVTSPTEGRVTVNGRVAPLISVGVGFHPELTGRENVYVNATILGLSRADVDDRFEEIVAFSEIADFIDTPVKFYSSGMFVRLGFSVSVLAEPDVLLIDEVLAVGDLAFQMKCFERMEQLRLAGTTIVIVTHNLNAVRRLCDRTLVVHDGQVAHDGDTAEALSTYHDLLGRPVLSADDDPGVADPTSGSVADIEEAELLGPGDHPTRHAEFGDRLALEATIRLRAPIDDAILGLVVVSESGVHVYGERWNLSDIASAPLGAGSTVRVRGELDAQLATGSYNVQFGLASADGERPAASMTPILFYISGRPTVRGLVDLGGEIKVSGGEAYPTPSDAAGTGPSEA